MENQDLKEYCEWRLASSDKILYHILCQSDNFLTIFNPRGINYCPWCGKLIKEITEKCSETTK